MRAAPLTQHFNGRMVQIDRERPGVFMVCALMNEAGQCNLGKHGEHDEGSLVGCCLLDVGEHGVERLCR
ncbi:hypothetical protein DEDE109153_02490 [Deinococcus deserti]